LPLLSPCICELLTVHIHSIAWLSFGGN